MGGKSDVLAGTMRITSIIDQKSLTGTRRVDLQKFFQIDYIFSSRNEKITWYDYSSRKVAKHVPVAREVCLYHLIFIS